MATETKNCGVKCSSTYYDHPSGQTFACDKHMNHGMLHAQTTPNYRVRWGSQGLQFDRYKVVKPSMHARRKETVKVDLRYQGSDGLAN